MTIPQAMQTAFDHQCAGRFAQAEQLYRQVLAAQPRNPDALHLLGLIAAQVGQFDTAAELISRAITIRPGIWDYHRHLGAVMLDQGKPDQAIDQLQRAIALNPNVAASHEDLARAYEAKNQFDQALNSRRKAAALDPNSADNWCNLGSLLQLTGQSAEAVDASRRAIALNPNLAEAHNNLAAALTKLVKPKEGEQSARRAIALKPDLAQAHNTLASALWTQRDFSGAITAAREAIRLMPNFAAAYNNLGASLSELRQMPEAATACRRAIEIDPNITPAGTMLRDTLCVQPRPNAAETACRQAIAANPKLANAHVNLALILMSQGEYDEAIVACREAIRLRPDLGYAYDNLAHALKHQGRMVEAVDALRTAVGMELAYFYMHSALVFNSCYLPEESPDGNLATAKTWATRWAAGLGGNRPRPPEGESTSRRLRIGYVSPDFRDHPVARFMLPLLASHDHSRFEIHCFAAVAVEDDTTARIRGLADRWHDVVMTDDTALAELVRSEQIDILVDLAGHTSGNRLLTFAREPAPVLVSYLGYPASTGVDTIDYRLTDPQADPPGMTESHHTEKLIRLPRTAWCYQPEVEVGPPSVRDPCAPVTFGCFNNFAKVNEPMLRLWAQIVLRVPNSRLMLKSASLGSPSLSAQTRRILEAAGVAPDRMELHAWSDSSAAHLRCYDQVDIALDTFPYHGTTTTCEALWMGAPVVTLAGHTHLSRVGVSLLHNVGLSNLVAQSREEYADIAVSLAADKARLRDLRGSLRDRMLNSPLMDAAGFTRDVELAYQQMYSESRGVSQAGL
jgi:predicted O-linked N-acetylglucosamine transferase (SPINDLY family)